MIRFLIVFLITISASLGILWLNENNGIIEILWFGYKIKATSSFIILSLIILFFSFYLILKIISGIIKIPFRIKNSFNKKSLENNYKTLEVGVLNLLSSDFAEAKKIYNKLQNNISDKSNYNILFNAFEAKLFQSEGKFIEAKKSYEKLLNNKEAKFFAVKGLLETSSEEGNLVDAKNFAEKAYEINPKFKDGAHSLLELYKNSGDLDSAFKFLDKYRKRNWFRKDYSNNINTNNEYSYLWLEKAKNIFKEKEISELKKIIGYDYILKSLKYNNANSNAIELLLNHSENSGNINDLIKYFRKFWAYEQNLKLTKQYLEIISKNKKRKLKYINSELHKLAKIKINLEVIQKLRESFIGN